VEDFLYTPYELALIIYFYRMNSVDSVVFLENIFKFDNAFIESKYRHEQKKFMLDVMNMMNYLSNQEQFALETNAINQDMNDFGLKNNIQNNSFSELNVHNMIFKEMRLKIQYINKNGYTKMKLRTLINKLGYKKRSPVIINYILDCLLFYHISVSLKNNVQCDIAQENLDKLLTFRII